MSKIVTVAVAGAGGRGRNSYGNLILKMQDKIKVVAVADLIREKVDLMAKEHSIPADMCFDSAEAMLQKDRLADYMFICTQDRDHYGHAMAALEKGYHLLLEKPISPSLSECKEIAELANKKNLNVIVCHVLRYTPFYNTLKDVIDSGRIGKIMTVNAEECVGYWHQAHSFVRGNWRNSNETSPMILAKCCHDMDILLWLLGKKCLKVSSFGSLNHFNIQNAPEGSAERCSNCAPDTKKDCPYDCEKLYLDGPRGVRNGYKGWPLNILCNDPTEEKTLASLAEGPYGRCVYHCDNNVVDNQVVNMLLEGNVTLNFTMSAFTSDIRRTLRIRGTHGEILGDMEGKTLRVTEFGKPTEIIDTSKTNPKASAGGTGAGHGGGDAGLLNSLVGLFNGEDVSKTISSINDSIASHFLALAAEESRLNNGKVIDIDEWNARF